MGELMRPGAFPAWGLIWQSTLFLAAGVLASLAWSRWPARAHRALVLSMVAALGTPLLSLTVRGLGWGWLAEPSTATTGPRAWLRHRTERAEPVASAVSSAGAGGRADNARIDEYLGCSTGRADLAETLLVRGAARGLERRERSGRGPFAGGRERGPAHDRPGAGAGRSGRATRAGCRPDAAGARCPPRPGGLGPGSLSGDLVLGTPAGGAGAAGDGGRRGGDGLGCGAGPRVRALAAAGPSGGAAGRGAGLRPALAPAGVVDAPAAGSTRGTVL